MSINHEKYTLVIVDEMEENQNDVKFKQIRTDNGTEFRNHELESFYSDISYYVIPHGRSLSELTQENQVLEVIAPNEPDIPHTEDTEGPLDLINIEGTHEKNVQNDQMITQPIDVPSRNNTEVSGSITESLVPNVTQSLISNQPLQACLQEAWLLSIQLHQLVNVYLLTLSEIKPKKASKALEHLGWVDAIQEELN
ncbi:hypothetical protein Tco_0811963 [Tanacetum coccineum]